MLTNLNNMNLTNDKNDKNDKKDKGENKACNPSTNEKNTKVEEK